MEEALDLSSDGLLGEERKKERKKEKKTSDKCRHVHLTGHDGFIRRPSQIEAMPWYRRLVAGISPPNPHPTLLQPGPVRGGFVVDRVAQRKVPVRFRRSFPDAVITPKLQSVSQSSDAV